MKVTLLAATSINGFIARLKGDEDFLSSENWLELIRYSKEYGHVIWGRETYDSVVSWGSDHIARLNNVPIIIISRNKNLKYPENVTICGSPEEAMEAVRQMGFKKALVSGGARINAWFVKSNLITDLVISYNPSVIQNGLGVFGNSDNFDIKLEILNTKMLGSDIIQVHYSVTKVILK